jgi:hypothetical protein
MQVRAGKQAGVDSGGAQDRFYHGGDAALAFAAGDVHGYAPELRVVQLM